jgi:signal transduction histidine kinase
MGQLLTEVMGKMKLVTKTHSVELLASEEAYVYGDKVTLRQLLRIFLENSIKYTPAGGHITASCRKMPEGEKLEVVLADDGIGIAKEEQQKIFERFYRVDSSRTKGTGAGGTGLGLSIAKWIAEQHGIAISMDSAPGRGTRIHLLIPLADRSKGKTETIEA